MSPVPPAMSPLMMWPASSTMSEDRSTAFVHDVAGGVDGVFRLEGHGYLLCG